MTIEDLAGHFVVKGGGDVNKDAETVLSFCEYIVSDPRRKIVVTSAPGKRKEDTLKLTQFLFREVAPLPK